MKYIEEDLVNLSGIEASLALVEKVRDPGMALYIGGTLINRIVSVHHFHDGMPVVLACITEKTVVDPDDCTDQMQFQYTPNNERFTESAMNQDGSPIQAPSAK